MALAEGSSVSQLLCFMPPDRAGSRLLPRNTPAMMFVEPKPLCEGDPREGSRLFLEGSSSWVRMLRGRCIPISGLWLPRGSGECADIDSSENELTEIAAPNTLGRPRVAGLSAILPPGSVLRFISGALPPPAPRPRAAGIYEAPIAAAEGLGDRGARVVCLVGVRFIPPAASPGKHHSCEIRSLGGFWLWFQNEVVCVAALGSEEDLRMSVQQALQPLLR